MKKDTNINKNKFIENDSESIKVLRIGPKETIKARKE